MDDLTKSYGILELEAGASRLAVERAYRELSRVWHPDRFATDAPSLQDRARDRQQQINAAYECLTTYLDTPALGDAPSAGLAARTADLTQSSAVGPLQAAPARAEMDSPLRRLGEIVTAVVGPILRHLVVPAVVRRLSDPSGTPDRDRRGASASDGAGRRPQRQRARDGSGAGRGCPAEGGRGGSGQGQGGGRGRVNGGGRRAAGRRGQ